MRLGSKVSIRAHVRYKRLTNAPKLRNRTTLKKKKEKREEKKGGILDQLDEDQNKRTGKRSQDAVLLLFCLLLQHCPFLPCMCSKCCRPSGAQARVTWAFFLFFSSSFFKSLDCTSLMLNLTFPPNQECCFDFSSLSFFLVTCKLSVCNLTQERSPGHKCCVNKNVKKKVFKKKGGGGGEEKENKGKDLAVFQAVY